MSPVPTVAGLSAPQVKLVEQRLCRRYPIPLNVHYRLLTRPKTDRGSGRTLNISSGGVLFKPETPLPVSESIELALEWPVLLDGTCHLQLVLHGYIVRSDPAGTAIQIINHDFRTSKRRLV